MALAQLRRVEGFLDGAQVADGDIGRFHPRYPALAKILHKYTGEDRAQFLLVGRSRTPVAEFAAGEIRPAEHFDDETAIQPVIGAGDIKRRVGSIVDADGGRP